MQLNKKFDSLDDVERRLGAAGLRIPHGTGELELYPEGCLPANFVKVCALRASFAIRLQRSTGVSSLR